MKHWLDMVVTLLQAPTGDLRELARIAGADPQIFYRGVDLRDLDVADQDLEGMQFGDCEPDCESLEDTSQKKEQPRVSRLFVARGRQEERVSMMLDLILQDRESGIAALNGYASETAKFASYAFSEMKLLFLDSNSELNDEAIAASLVPRFFSYTFPLNRGRLLYFMAVHLAKYPLVNNAIRTNLNKTASMFVNEYRSRIESSLNVPREK